MDTLMSRHDIHLEAMERIKKLGFGDAVSNICAGDGNPHRTGYFSRLKINSHKNRWGITHSDYWAECTDKKGKFWCQGIEITYPGHLDYEECKKLFAPIHAIFYPKE